MSYSKNTSEQRNKSVTVSKPVSIKQTNSVKAILRPKLKIGQSDDKYEQEADRVADQVMRMPEPHSASLAGDSSQTNSSISRKGTIQRVCSSCLEDKELLQTKTNENVTPKVTPGISSNIQSLQGGGQPLSQSERSFFDPRFGTNFSGVRVHNDARAASVARSVNARAFTLGRDVVFGSGEYSPDSSAGRKLLAHELTHVVQQNDCVNRRCLTPLIPFQTGTQNILDGRVEPETMRFLNERGSKHLRRQPASPRIPLQDEEEKTGYTQCDFIHDRIDVDAQKSLNQLYKEGGTERSAAIRIWAAVKNGKLSGIYQQDRKKPALMARDHNKYWWTMITDGDAMVFPEKVEEFPEEIPLLVYKKSLANNIAGLATNLQKAWSKRPDIAPGSIPDPSLRFCITKWHPVPLSGLEGRCGGGEFKNPKDTYDSCGNRIKVYCDGANWIINFHHKSGKITKVGECVYEPGENELDAKKDSRSGCFTHVSHRTEDRSEETGYDGERWQHSEYIVAKGDDVELWCRKGKKHPYDWIKSSNDTCKKDWLTND